MTFEQFAYWLQGFAEINGSVPNPLEWNMIKEHLATCFVKVTGKMEPPLSTEEIIEQLKEIDMEYKRKKETFVRGLPNEKPMCEYTTTFPLTDGGISIC